MSQLLKFYHFVDNLCPFTDRLDNWKNLLDPSYPDPLFKGWWGNQFGNPEDGELVVTRNPDLTWKLDLPLYDYSDGELLSQRIYGPNGQWPSGTILAFGCDIRVDTYLPTRQAGIAMEGTNRLIVPTTEWQSVSLLWAVNNPLAYVHLSLIPDFGGVANVPNKVAHFRNIRLMTMEAVPQVWENQLPNGTFETATGWVLGDGWSHDAVNDEMDFTDPDPTVPGDLSTALDMFKAGTNVLVEFDIVSWTGAPTAGIRAEYDRAPEAGQWGETVRGTGTKRAIFTNVSAAGDLLIAPQITPDAFAIDNVVAKRITQIQVENWVDAVPLTLSTGSAPLLMSVVAPVSGGAVLGGTAPLEYWNLRQVVAEGGVVLSTPNTNQLTNQTWEGAVVGGLGSGGSLGTGWNAAWEEGVSGSPQVDDAIEVVSINSAEVPPSITLRLNFPEGHAADYIQIWPDDCLAVANGDDVAVGVYFQWLSGTIGPFAWSGDPALWNASPFNDVCDNDLVPWSDRRLINIGAYYTGDDYERLQLRVYNTNTSGVTRNYKPAFALTVAVLPIDNYTFKLSGFQLQEGRDAFPGEAGAEIVWVPAVVPFGGVTMGGSAPYSVARVPATAGQLEVDGSAPTPRVLVPATSGQVILNGAAGTLLAFTWPVTPVGQVTLNGAAPLDMVVVPVPAGGVEVGGTSGAPLRTWGWTPQAGVALNGLAPIWKNVWTFLTEEEDGWSEATPPAGSWSEAASEEDEGWDEAADATGSFSQASDVSGTWTERT